MKVFVTGVSGQLGYDMVRELEKRGHTAIGSAREPDSRCQALCVRLDIADGEAVENVLAHIKPDAVIHCASWTAVDAAENEENQEKVYSVNVEGTKRIAAACKKLDCKMIYISTDYVFGGDGDMPWDADGENFAPLSVYGRTKLEGELAVKELLEKYFIVRISWSFGINGKNFVKTMLELGKKYDELKVVCDQVGTPTYTYDLSRLLVDMIETEKYGCYHATNEGGYISWYEFACAIFGQAGYDIKITPVTTKEYGVSKAARPLNSRLDKSKLIKEGFMPLPKWQDALSRYLEELKKAEQR